MQRKIPTVIDGVTNWLCSRCREYKPESGFYRANKRWNGLCSYCKDCSNTVNATWAEQNDRPSATYASNPERFKAYARAFRLRNAAKCKARDTLNNAVRLGHVKRPYSCSFCGDVCQPEGHHTDYTKPLHVIWLCRPCHELAHRKLRTNPNP